MIDDADNNLEQLPSSLVNYGQSYLPAPLVLNPIVQRVGDTIHQMNCNHHQFDSITPTHWVVYQKILHVICRLGGPYSEKL